MMIRSMSHRLPRLVEALTRRRPSARTSPVLEALEGRQLLTSGLTILHPPPPTPSLVFIQDSTILAHPIPNLLNQCVRLSPPNANYVQAMRVTAEDADGNFTGLYSDTSINLINLPVTGNVGRGSVANGGYLSSMHFDGFSRDYKPLSAILLKEDVKSVQFNGTVFDNGTTLSVSGSIAEDHVVNAVFINTNRYDFTISAAHSDGPVQGQFHPTPC